MGHLPSYLQTAWRTSQVGLILLVSTRERDGGPVVRCRSALTCMPEIGQYRADRARRTPSVAGVWMVQPSHSSHDSARAAKHSFRERVSCDLRPLQHVNSHVLTLAGPRAYPWLTSSAPATSALRPRATRKATPTSCPSGTCSARASPPVTPKPTAEPSWQLQPTQRLCAPCHVSLANLQQPP